MKTPVKIFLSKQNQCCSSHYLILNDTKEPEGQKKDSSNAKKNTKNKVTE
jgi:hypothetical protein